MAIICATKAEKRDRGARAGMKMSRSIFQDQHVLIRTSIELRHPRRQRRLVVAPSRRRLTPLSLRFCPTGTPRLAGKRDADAFKFPLDDSGFASLPQRGHLAGRDASHPSPPLPVLSKYAPFDC